MKEFAPYLEKWKLFILKGIESHTIKSPVPLAYMEKKLNAYIKENGINSPKIPAKDIKQVIRWAQAEGYPIGVVNKVEYFWANDTYDMEGVVAGYKFQRKWLDELIADLLKVDYYKKPEEVVKPPIGSRAGSETAKQEVLNI